jgi:hypothetical protein
MINRLKISLLSLSVIALLSFKAEETPFEKLLKQLAKISAAYPQEKVHLHLDKPYYAIGEDIWLKAYVVTAEKNEPSLLSKVLYVDLINSKNIIAKKLTLPVDNSLAFGNISLLDSLSSGTYRIRAYTNYMRNYAYDFFFEKTIEIGNVIDIPDTKTVKNKEKKVELNLQFFPEGGNLLVGNRTKIAVKAVTSNGLGANLSGYIINRNKEKVAEFITEHAGMGAFAFTPLADENYTAVVTGSDGSTQSFDLPKAATSGHALAINNSKDDVNVQIFSSQDLVKGQDLSVVAQSNGTVYASFTTKIDARNLIARIPIKNLPTGITHITLFNKDNDPLVERLIFVDHEDQLKININNETPQALPLKKVQLDLAVVDVNGNPIDGSFSVAITDSKKVSINEDDETTILSNLLLTSDLKGYVESPNYYFNEANADRKKHLDHLLLTQGWSRFTWQDVKNSKEPALAFRPEQSLEITGKITNEYNKPLANSKISLISTTPGLFLKIDTVSNALGNFIFDQLDLPDSSSFMVQAKSIKGSKAVNIRMDKRPSISDFNYIGTSINIEPYLQSTKELYVELNKFNMLHKGISLKQVTITAPHVLKPIVNVKGSTNASGAVDYLITKQMLKSAFDIYSPFLTAKGVMIDKGKIVSTRGKGPLLIILDGTPISQIQMPEFLSTINPKDLEGIEILTSSYNVAVLGSEAAGGVIYITTHSGGLDPEPATNVAKLTNIGYSTIKQFYVPAYDDPKTNRNMQDLRSTIYWNPNLNTNINGQASFSFFNASTPGKYRVTIEGIDIFGNIGRKVYTYEVSELN